MPLMKAPFGTWTSSITASAIAAKGESIQDVLVDPQNGQAYYLESRPAEGGRVVLCRLNVIEDEDGRRTSSNSTDVFGPGWNARSRVNEYGGAAAHVFGGVAYFSNFPDGRVYAVRADHDSDGEQGVPVAVTPESKRLRYADFAIHPTKPHLILCVCDDFERGEKDVQTRLVLLDTAAQSVTFVRGGADFYAAPAFNADGSHVAWIQRDYPEMPWYGSKLFVAEVRVEGDAMSFGEPTYIAGQHMTVSVLEPRWADARTLVFLCDKPGFSVPHTFSLDAPQDPPRPFTLSLSRSESTSAVAATEDSDSTGSNIEEDFELAPSLLGTAGYALLETRWGVFSAWRDGRSVLYLGDLREGSLVPLECPYVTVSAVRAVAKDRVYFLGGSLDRDTALVELIVSNLNSGSPTGAPAARFRELKAKSPLYGPEWISRATPTSFQVQPSGETVHLVYYAPRNPGYEARDGGVPPAVVGIHGGPTSMETQALNWVKQYFTTRGWAWVDVNHRGSAGYGRVYRDALNGGWGITEVHDAASAVSHLAALHLLDPARTVIRGGSAGGYTTLCALSTAPARDVFAAGTSLFGISDLRKLQEIPHKFESHYNQTLLGGTLEDIPEVWKARSPVSNAGEIKAPLLLLQGAVDPVVPPSQAEIMVQTIRDNGGVVECVVYEGEGHGWRKAETIEAALEREIAFYERVLRLKE